MRTEHGSIFPRFPTDPKPLEMHSGVFSAWPRENTENPAEIEILRQRETEDAFMNDDAMPF